MITTKLDSTYDDIDYIYTSDGSEITVIYADTNGTVIYYGLTDILGATPLFYRAYGKDFKNYQIYGNTLQSGTPTPDMPVDVVGCGVRTENLFDNSAVTLGKWYTNLGTLQNQPYGAISKMQIVSADNYTIKWYGLKPYSVSYVWFDSNKDFISRTHHGGIEGISDMYTDTVPSNAVYFILQMSNGINASNPITVEQLETYRTMLNLGSEALPYEPYGYKLPLTVNGTEYPIYLGQVETTRRIKKLVLTGEESVSVTATGMAVIVLNTPPVVGEECVCSHYIGTNVTAYSAIGAGECTTCIVASNGGNRLVINDVSLSTADAYKAFFATQYANGTPVTVWYVLAEPETAVVNEPLHKIGDYSDTISYAQAGVTIPTVSGTNILSVETEVQPSEVYLKGHVKPTGYGDLTDVNDVYIQDVNGVQIQVHGQA